MNHHKQIRSVAVASIILASLFAGIPVSTFADAKGKNAAKGLTEEQKILHVLNRLSYGPRPGDPERVKRLGIEKYIDQQLHPERIDDSAVNAKLTGFESLHMSIAQVHQKYPQPNMIARELGLGRKGGAKSPDKPNASDAQESAPQNDAALQKQYREEIQAYYAQHGLKLPIMLLQELQAQKIIRATYSERQLQEVMTDFWFNHFNIFWPKGGDKWMTTDYEMNTIRPNTMGKFKDLLLATAKSPAMLFYLDNFQSMSPDAKLPARRALGAGPGLGRRPGLLGGPVTNRRIDRPGDYQRDRDMQRDADQMDAEQQRRQQLANQLRNRKPGINENYAREIMELHTLSVNGGYTQKDVQEVARCFTGWTIENPRQGGRYIFRERVHDDREKIVLGHKIPAGGGIKDGEMVIDILAHHPNTAKFIATKLTRRFVSDNPPQALVDKVAAVYLKTDGDIREMLRTIFTSPEFYSAEAYRAKIKSPFELAISAIRAVGGDTNGSAVTGQFIARMGQPLYRYQAPTGYPDSAEQWVNTGALLERLNFGIALSSNRVRGTTVDVKRLATGTNTVDSAKIMERAIAILLNGDVSTQTRTVLEKQLKEGVSVKGELTVDSKKHPNDEMESIEALLVDDQMPIPGKGKANRLERLGRRLDANNVVAMSEADQQFAKVFGLVLGSPEFQRR